MVAVAVRYAAELIQNETVHIRDGRKPAREYELAKDTVLKPRKQGLAMERPVVQLICILFGRKLLNCSTQVLPTSR